MILTTTVVRVTSGIHVAVVDRYLTFADTLAAGLRPHEDVVDATALTDTESLWQALRSSVVDVVLLDQDLLGIQGDQLLRQILEEYPTTKVVVLSSAFDPPRVVHALTSGAAGWMPKNLPLEELLHGLRTVHGGETWVPARLLTAVLRAMAADQAGRPSAEAGLRSLTTRERQILQCMVDGMSRSEIAEHLGMSPNTVRTHVHNLLHKLGAHSSLRAVAIAREAGLAREPRSSATEAGSSTPTSERPNRDAP